MESEGNRKQSKNQSSQSKFKQDNKSYDKLVKQLKTTTKQKQSDKVMKTETNDWYVILVKDIQFILETIDKGVLQKIDDNVRSRIQDLFNVIIDYKEISKEFYYYSMHIIDNMLNDDHSTISLVNFKQVYGDKMQYSGFIAEMIYNGIVQEGQLIVKHSIDKRIPIQSIIRKINGKPAHEYIERQTRSFCKQTNSQMTNMKNQALQLSIFNPIMPMKTIQLIDNKQNKSTVDIQYRISKKGYFDTKKIFDVFHELLIKNHDQMDQSRQVYMRKLDAANLLYLDIHQFPSYDNATDRLLEQMPLMLDDNYQWIILDLRSNFGGSLKILFSLIFYLYGQDLAQNFYKCVKYTLATNKVMNQQYYDQMILPIVSNNNIPQKIRTEIKKSFKDDIQNKNSQFKIVKQSVKQKSCNKNVHEDVKKRLSNDILKDKYFKKVIIIVDHLCFSACIHTSKFIMQFPNVITIGHQIGKTQMSGNTIGFNLPSNQGSLYIPQLLFENTNKQIQQIIHQESNQPDIFVSDNMIYDTDKLIVEILQNKTLFNKIYRQKAKQYQK